MNKRIRLYREDHPTIDNRVLTDTTWAPEPLPLLVQTQNGQGHWDTNIIGTVEHLRRSRDGWVTGVIKTPADPKGLFAEADFDSIQNDASSVEDGVLTLKGARLRAITLGIHPAWKEMTRT